MKKFTPLAMKCTEKQFKSIKNKLKKSGCKIVDLDKFSEFIYLTNKFGEEQNTISNLHPSQDKLRTRWEIHETFSAKIFLEACGIETDVYEITKEQVLRIAEREIKESKLRQWFPDAFKKELEVGKWYKNPSRKSFMYFNEINGNTCLGYGFDNVGVWNDKLEFFTNNWQEATPQEVEAALICEAKKRGFVDKISFNKLEDIENGIIFAGEARVGSCFYFENNKLYTTGRGKWCVFKDGQWAQII